MTIFPREQPAAPGVLMLDVNGTELSADEEALLASPVVGGVILFARNYESPEQVQALNKSIRACNSQILIAVDQEGGPVQRLIEGYTRLPAMGVFASRWRAAPEQTQALATQVGWLMAAEMLSAGFDFSFAPVLDINIGLSKVIGERAFGSDAAQVAALANAFMAGMHEAGMATTGKHFPGHGSVQADSHLELPVDDRSLKEIRSTDLEAFVACLNSLDAVMPAHVIYPQVDPHCAGFSPFWLQEILRGEMGFDGVIFSDDLVMAGAAAVGGIETRVDAALEAGCDMVLVCNSRPMALAAKAHLEAQGALANPRLLRMQRSKMWQREQLMMSDRWTQARALVAELMEAKGD
jgi:beta-N-acetylhexosaminidase